MWLNNTKQVFIVYVSSLLLVTSCFFSLAVKFKRSLKLLHAYYDLKIQTKFEMQWLFNGVWFYSLSLCFYNF